MKKTKIFLLLFVGWIGLHGQEYVPLLDTNKVWNVYEDMIYWGETNPLYLELCETDSTRFIIFKKDQYSQNPVEMGYLSEDTISQKIYYTDLHDNEVLLYDFSLSEGDVFNYNPVTKVDSVQLLDGTYRKRIAFGPSYYYHWIEGIGSIFGGLLWIYWDFKKHIPEAWLLCYYKNDELLFRNDDYFYFYDGCNYSFLNDITETTGNSPILKVYPNPFTQKVSISFENLIQGEAFELVIKTLEGRTVYNEPLFSDISIDLSFLDKGIYLLTLRNNHFQFTERIIKL